MSIVELYKDKFPHNTNLLYVGILIRFSYLIRFHFVHNYSDGKVL